MKIQELLNEDLNYNELDNNLYSLDSPKFKIKALDHNGNHVVFYKPLGKRIGMVKLKDSLYYAMHAAERTGVPEGPVDIEKIEIDPGVNPRFTADLKFELTKFLVGDTLTRMDVASMSRDDMYHAKLKREERKLRK